MKGIDDILLNGAARLRQKLFVPKEFEIKVRVIPSVSKTNKAIFFFHGWGSKSNTFIYLYNRLKKDYNIILLDYPKHVVSDDTEKTLDYFDQLLKKTAEIIKQLRDIGVEEFNFIGISLGGFLCIYIANKLSLKCKIFIGVGGSRISDAFWYSIGGITLKENLMKKGFDLKKLRKAWKNIEPENNLANLKGSRIFFQMSENDMLVPYRLQKELLDALIRSKAKVRSRTDKVSGHYFTIVKSLANYNLINDFFSGNDKTEN